MLRVYESRWSASRGLLISDTTIENIIIVITQRRCKVATELIARSVRVSSQVDGNSCNRVTSARVPFGLLEVNSSLKFPRYRLGNSGRIAKYVTREQHR